MSAIALEQVHRITLTVNGAAATLEVSARTLLVELLRDRLQLTGTHVGCDTTQCGACTVHVDGAAIKSCTMLAVQAQGRAVTTIEGLSPDGEHPLQRSFRECHALQCGFCTPGMIMAAAALIDGTQDLDEAAVRAGLDGNLCRCTGYQPIVEAVLAAARDAAPAAALP